MAGSVEVTASRNRKVCPSCNLGSASGSRFCARCGAALAASAIRPEAATRRADGVGERRPLTVLFCDIVDSTRLTQELDPEDLRRVLLDFREACIGAVEAHGGMVSHYIGDAVLAHFGFPRAHEDDAARAIRAGLRMLAALPALNRRLAGEVALTAPLAARAGAHSGLVVVADLGSGRHAEQAAVVGETTTIAARLQQAAAPGQLIVSEATRRLAPAAFRFAELGELTLKGVMQPLLAHRVLGEQAPGAPPPGRHGPFVAREAELRVLLAAWREAAAGAGAALLVEGEPGMGKSRLVQEFRARGGMPAGDAVTLLCAEHDRASAFHPVTAWLLGRLGLPPGAPAATLRARLCGLIAGAGLSEAEIRAPLAALLGCADEADAREVAALPRRRHRRTIEALAALLLASRREGHPLLIVVEDLHWADPSTEGLLRVLAERGATRGRGTMLLLTARPDWRATPPIPALPTLRLERLAAEEARRLVDLTVAGRLPPALVSRIVARADGVPLFLEEVARAAAETPETGGGIPFTLRGSLMARLDALGEAKPVAELAAVLGRRFEVAVLEAVLGEAERAPLRRSLRRLVQARFLEPDGPPGEAGVYTFRHALIHDAAYDALLREQRRALHARVVAVLRDRFPQKVAARPEVLARHLAMAGRESEAIEAFEAAARLAAAQAAHAEALAHCRNALALVGKLPEGRRRLEAEMRLNVALAAQTTIVRGNAEPEVLRAFERAHAAAQRLGDAKLTFRTMRGLITFHLVRGDIGAGLAASRRLMRHVAGESDPAVLVQAHRAHGLSLLYGGRFTQARQELRRALDLYDPASHAMQRFDYGSDPAVLALSHLGWVEWFLGEPERARQDSEAAVAAARALDHPHSLAFALAFHACLGQFLGDRAMAHAAAVEAIRVARLHDYAYWTAWGTMLQGWAMAREGDEAGGERLLRQGLQDYAGTGAGLLRPYGLYLLAEAIAARRGEEALALLDEALAEAEAHGIRFWRTQTLRLRAALRDGMTQATTAPRPRRGTTRGAEGRRPPASG